MLFSATTATNKIQDMTKRIRIVQGGTSASKTISILLFLIAMAQTDTEPTLTSVVSESFPHLRRGCIRDFLNIMQTHKYFKDALWNKSESTYTFETGSKIEFFSADQSAKLRGARRDRLFLNEANNVPLDAFEQLEVRTLEFVYLDYNPTTEFWSFTEVCGCGKTGCVGKRTDTEHIILTYLDNEALDKAIVDSIEQRRNNKAWFQVYGLGLLGEIETQIYRGWKIIDEVPFEARLERFGIDFGYTNDPTAIVAVYYYNGGYIIDELAYNHGLINKQIAGIIKAQPKVVMTIADSAEPKSIDELRAENLTVLPSKKGQGSVLQGIQYVQAQQISVTKNSINLIKEYRNYVWITDKDGKIINEPDHLFSHGMDAVRYALNAINNPNRLSAYTHYPKSSLPRNNITPFQNIPTQDLPPELKEERKFAYTHIPHL
jgi:phage terminase large subunit